MTEAHRALTEDPAYFDMLCQLDEIAVTAVSKPVFDEEFEKVSATPVYRTDAENVIRAINSYDFRPYNIDDFPASAQQIIRGRRLGTFDIDYIKHRTLKEEVQASVRNNGVAGNCIGSTEEVLVYKEGEFTSFMPDFEYAMAYWGARQITTSRLRSEEVQLQVQLALGPETEDGAYHKLARVADDKQPQHSALRYPLEAFVEGYDSVAFAGFHLEMGGFRGATTHPDFVRAMADYTRLIPISGLLAPMAMRGEYFRGLIDPDTLKVDQGYKAVFTEYRAEKRLGKPNLSTMDTMDEESSGQSSFEAGDVTSDEQRNYLNETGFPADQSYRKDLSYEGEGCPAAYYRIVHHAAALFQSTVQQLLERDLPDAPQLELSEVVRQADSRNRRR